MGLRVGARLHFRDGAVKNRFLARVSSVCLLIRSAITKAYWWIILYIDPVISSLFVTLWGSTIRCFSYPYCKWKGKVKKNPEDVFVHFTIHTFIKGVACHRKLMMPCAHNPLLSSFEWPGDAGWRVVSLRIVRTLPSVRKSALATKGNASSLVNAAWLPELPLASCISLFGRCLSCALRLSGDNCWYWGSCQWGSRPGAAGGLWGRRCHPTGRFLKS